MTTDDITRDYEGKIRRAKLIIGNALLNNNLNESDNNILMLETIEKDTSLLKPENEHLLMRILSDCLGLGRDLWNESCWECVYPAPQAKWFSPTKKNKRKNIC